MMKTLQRLGKSLMLPVAVLPVAAILMGIGYWIDPTGWGANNIAAAFLFKAGSAVIDNIPILFALGVAIGMSDDGEGTAALAGLVSWLMVTKGLLAPASMALFLGIDLGAVDPAFGKIENAFIGMLCGIIGAVCYNRFKNTRLPDALSFFSGKRCVAIVTAGVTMVASLILAFIWPPVYNALVAFGEGVVSLGAIGSGIYGFFNRLLIPFGLHHALNSVFWFDIAGIDDIGKFLGSVEGGVRGVTGMYQTGFFPVMMFGLPGAALAMYHTAKPNKKKIAAGLLLSAAFASFFTGITEPLEFAFMFLAPPLYLVHAVLTGASNIVATLLPVRSGFAFSAGFIDWILSFKNPMAVNPLLIIPIGLAFSAVYYFLFRFMITKFKLKTPGREDDEIGDDEKNLVVNGDFAAMAETIIEGLGGKENITSLDNCITRLRIEVAKYELVNEKKIKSSGAAGIMRPSKTAVQVIVGTKVQFVADEMNRLMK
jgi:PTS system N-acetylglucosamine-specific IIC component